MNSLIPYEGKPKSLQEVKKQINVLDTSPSADRIINTNHLYVGRIVLPNQRKAPQKVSVVVVATKTNIEPK